MQSMPHLWMTMFIVNLSLTLMILKKLYFKTTKNNNLMIKTISNQW